MPQFHRPNIHGYKPFTNFLEETESVFEKHKCKWKDVKSIQIGKKKRISVDHFKKLAGKIDYKPTFDSIDISDWWDAFDRKDWGIDRDLVIFFKDGSYMVRALCPRADDEQYIGDIQGWMFIEALQPDMSLKADDTIEESEIYLGNGNDDDEDDDDWDDGDDDEDDSDGDEDDDDWD